MPMTRRTRVRTCLMLTVVPAALLVGCGPAGNSAADLSDAPHGIVVNRGGAVEVLDSTTKGTPRHVAGEDQGGATADPLTLTEVQQLARRTIAGLRGGQLVVVDPAHADTARTIAPASYWFPDTALTGAWTVTESLDQPACPGISGTTAGTARFRVERHNLDSGKVVTAAKPLPCRMRPVADTAEGLLVSTLHDQVVDNGHGGAVSADLQLVKPGTFGVIRTVQTSAQFIQAAGSTLITAPDDCKAGNCAGVLSLNQKHSATLGALPDGGTLTGSGLLDPTGRYFASAWASPDGDLKLIVCDLHDGATRTLGAYTALNPGSPGKLQDDMPAVWSGSRLLIANPQNGNLTTYQAATGDILTRNGLTTGGTLQVWGAES